MLSFLLFGKCSGLSDFVPPVRQVFKFSVVEKMSGRY